MLVVGLVLLSSALLAVFGILTVDWMEWTVSAQSTCLISLPLNLYTNGSRSDVSMKSKLKFIKLI